MRSVSEIRKEVKRLEAILDELKEEVEYNEDVEKITGVKTGKNSDIMNLYSGEYQSAIARFIDDCDLAEELLAAIKKAAEYEIRAANALPTSKKKDLAFINFRKNYGELARKLMIKNIESKQHNWRR